MVVSAPPVARSAQATRPELHDSSHAGGAKRIHRAFPLEHAVVEHHHPFRRVDRAAHVTTTTEQPQPVVVFTIRSSIRVQATGLRPAVGSSYKSRPTDPHARDHQSSSGEADRFCMPTQFPGIEMGHVIEPHRLQVAFTRSHLLPRQLSPFPQQEANVFLNGERCQQSGVLEHQPHVLRIGPAADRSAAG